MFAILQHDRLALSIGLVAGQLGCDFELIARFKRRASKTHKPRISGRRHAKTHGGIKALNTVVQKLVRQALMGRIRFGHHQKPAGVFVNPVHNPRTFHPTHTREIFAAMGQKRINQCSRRRAWCGMHNHSGRLVDHNQVVIFKQNLKRNIFRQHVTFHGFRQMDDNIIAGLHPRLLIGHHHAIHLNRTFRDHPRQSRPADRPLWHIPRQGFIKARWRVFSNGKKDISHGRSI